MAKRNRSKEQTTIYKTLHTNPTKNRGWSQVLRKGEQLLLH